MIAQVLLVDDEPSIRCTLAKFLEELGCFVTQAADVGEALALLNALEYDLVVTDIVMPKGSGLDVLRTVRSLEDPCPVVMITGSPMVESASEALRLGAPWNSGGYRRKTTVSGMIWRPSSPASRTPSSRWTVT
ncbi:response regulator [Geomonas diazotrophica]|uniref:response regulator n=1 Tax=Geomonas diazotrophica TaxID=2843197 RepID=UPI002E2E1744|nr:response regulator [Geomonas diazotrophica]